MKDKLLRIKILREVDEYNHRSIDYADFAKLYGCNKTEVQIEFFPLVNNGFISGQPNESEIVIPSITPAGAQYLKDNTLQLPPVRRRISDLFWTVLTHGCAMVIGFLLGLLTVYFTPADVKPKENHRPERANIETSERIVVPAVITDSAENEKQNKK